MENMDDQLYHELQKFLVKARNETFAGNGKFIHKRNRSKQYSYAHDKWKYRDEYFGSVIDIGMEIVYYENTPVWGINYFGGIKHGEFLDKKVVFSFLREALSHVDITYPFRGPKFFENRFGSYNCMVMGDIRFFSGKENIQVCGKTIYEKQFSGGAILY